MTKNRKTNHSIELRDLVGSGSGHQLRPNAILKILLFQPLLKPAFQETRHNHTFWKADWGSSIRV
jgi:hypothetical protein